jgi:hypothetical protein
VLFSACLLAQDSFTTVQHGYSLQLAEAEEADNILFVFLNIVFD